MKTNNESQFILAQRFLNSIKGSELYKALTSQMHKRCVSCGVFVGDSNISYAIEDETLCEKCVEELNKEIKGI